MSAYRFRVEGELLVLQVFEVERNQYSPDTGAWRDAKVQDIPVFEPFTPPRAEQVDASTWDPLRADSIARELGS